ncbi:anti-sigma F factor antagonist [Sporosarcina sp. P37]|uniref:STAS domain-containing protein n=1 Tax=unclassified Sporosarcina TaxID=2647733 RepID=UPI0009C1D79D|nr:MULTISPECIES: anti-sigma factor antagonist [unclassified Sporosarcina]ARD49412.1 anti-sigma F factor antagonist [Sporosarcina sp. P33]ARK25886.1 anti-sigma F factor antagonist [Sporosarcina sp. P37]
MATITQLENGIVLITLAGELDNHEANQIREEVSTAIFTGSTRAIIWDLCQLGFMDSAGIGLILGRMRDLVPVNGETLILNPSPTMEKLFQFSGLGDAIRNCTVEEAIDEIGGVVHEK